ncbi:hypothetical protein HEK616_61610 [Streptomyces nigrescens]|uniref:Transcriptional regulator n=2 Tax=Streptomyces TaxID=1883 RepID=A0ABM8A212_STRNI|nr:hypothetical protein [Streptomyces nigrescens]MEE4421149.1 hypothetical protein [Streptomyces sp. DSM 41528]BDM72674.1 hypothetical protein HEK616_61610 [Streptomyces nigrescens]
MLRVHFTGQDLARTRVAEGADPLWETALSLQILREDRGEPALAAWRQHAVRHGPGPVRTLFPLVPLRGYFPDFLTPYAALEGVEPGLEAVMRTPRTRLRAEVALLAGHRALPGEARGIGEGEPAALRQLARNLRTYHHLAVAPAWPRIAGRVGADRALRVHALAQSGAEAMLRTFGPVMRWRPPVLEVAYPVERELFLQGRGLVFVPSYFCRGVPIALVDDALPPVLVYPAAEREPAGPAGGPRAAAGHAEGPRSRAYGGGALGDVPVPAGVRATARAAVRR